jgi:hypothetical protein
LINIPEIPFDSLGFLPLAKQPDEVPFDLDKLPDSAFNYNDLPSRTFSFKVFSFGITNNDKG